MPKMTRQTRLVLAEFLKDPDAELYGRQISHTTGLHPGTVYTILDRLKEAGWLTSRREPYHGHPDYTARDHGRPPRHFYCFTSEGWALARQEAALARANQRRHA